MDIKPPYAYLLALLLVLVTGCAGKPQRPAPGAMEEPETLVAEPAEPAKAVVLRPDYPERYVVQKGDTLWDIASTFLRDPWRWPELWHVNPQIANPHLIYPGDVLILTFIDGRPVLQVQRGEAALPPETIGKEYPIVKLSPTVRVLGLERAVPTIPVDAIQQFLSRFRIVTDDELEEAPYLLQAADEHLIAGAGQRVYARGLQGNGPAEYIVVRRGQVYRNSRGRVLGYEAIHVADARVQSFGDPVTLLLTDSKREALVGDRLLPIGEETLAQSFMPRAPTERVKGEIVAVVDGVSQIGQYQTVVIDLGRQEGMERGHALAVYQDGAVVRDAVEGGSVKLPDERAGILMVYRIFERVSYALVMEATRTIYVHDTVTNP